MKSNMEQDILRVLYTEEQIKQRVAEMGEELYDRFADKNPMFVGVLSGCFVFMADLVRASQMSWSSSPSLPIRMVPRAPAWCRSPVTCSATSPAAT